MVNLEPVRPYFPHILSALFTCGVTLYSRFYKDTFLNSQTNIKGVFCAAATNMVALSLFHHFVKASFESRDKEQENEIKGFIAPQDEEQDVVTPEEALESAFKERADAAEAALNHAAKERADAADRYRESLELIGQAMQGREDELKRKRETRRVAEEHFRGLNDQKISREDKLNQIRIWVQMISDKKEEKKKIEEELNGLSEKNKTAEAQRQGYQKTRETLEAQKRDLEKGIKSQEQKYEEVKRKCVGIQGQLRALHKLNESLEAQVKDQREKFRSSNAGIQELARECDLRICKQVQQYQVQHSKQQPKESQDQYIKGQIQKRKDILDHIEQKLKRKKSLQEGTDNVDFVIERFRANPILSTGVHPPEWKQHFDKLSRSCKATFCGRLTEEISAEKKAFETFQETQEKIFLLERERDDAQIAEKNFSEGLENVQCEIGKLAEDETKSIGETTQVFEALAVNSRKIGEFEAQIKWCDKEEQRLQQSLDLVRELELREALSGKTQPIKTAIEGATRKLKGLVGKIVVDADEVLAEVKESYRKFELDLEEATRQVETITEEIDRLEKDYRAHHGGIAEQYGERKQDWESKHGAYVDAVKQVRTEKNALEHEKLLYEKYELLLERSKLYDTEITLLDPQHPPNGNAFLDLQQEKRRWIEKMMENKRRECLVLERKLGEEAEEVERAKLKVKCWDQKLLRHDLIIHWHEDPKDPIIGQKICKSLIKEMDYWLESVQLKKPQHLKLKISNIYLTYLIKANFFDRRYDFREHLIKYSNKNKIKDRLEFPERDDLLESSFSDDTENLPLYDIAVIARDDLLVPAQERQHKPLYNNIVSGHRSILERILGCYVVAQKYEKGLALFESQLELLRLPQEVSQSERLDRKQRVVGRKRDFLDQKRRFLGRKESVAKYLDIKEAARRRWDENQRRQQEQKQAEEQRRQEWREQWTPEKDTCCLQIPVVVLLAGYYFGIIGKVFKIFRGDLSWRSGRSILVISALVHNVIEQYSEALFSKVSNPVQG